ncbi:MAG TPA: glycosyl hydrolase family 28-related protein [Opitutaceae bacterium]|nr:glycosyl hydrolase family 28-related protein [Opitutaceae bacterium]
MRRTFFDVREFGAIGDGVFLDTAAINHAIAAAAEAGGGVVWFPAGDFLSYSIRLKSRVTLQLTAGTRIIAADPPPPGAPGGYDAPEGGPDNHLQDFGHSHFHNSLIWGENLEHVAIFGPGLIYGRGLSRGNGRIALPVGETAAHSPDKFPDVLEADGDVPPTVTLDRPPGPFGYPNSRDTLAAGIGNKAIALKNCRHVVLRDFTILHGGHFGVLASGTDNLTIDNLLVDTNRDGIDVDSCCNVRISNCSVNSPWDDGICLKASCGLKELRVVENVTISNCYVSGFVEGTLLDGTRSRAVKHRGGPIGRIKLGTEASGGFRNIAITNCVFEFCRGLALEQVDGGVLEDIVVSNISMREVMNSPLFIRLARRQRTPDSSAVGTAQRISISNLVAYDVSPEQGVFIAGVAGNPARDIRINGLEIHYRGGGTEDDGRREVPEMETGYPEPMLFGRLSSWGMFLRHVQDIRVSDVSLRTLTPDARPAVHLENVRGANFAGVMFDGPATTSQAWIQKNVAKLRIHPTRAEAR